MQVPHFLDIFLGSNDEEKKFLFLISTLMAVLVVEVSFSNISDIISKMLTSTAGIGLFVAMCGIYGIIQYLILKAVTKKNKQIVRDIFHVGILNRAVIIVQAVLTAIIFFGVLQIIFTSSYYTSLLIAATTISYGFAAVVMGILSYRLFSWFKLNKSLIILLYGLASIFITINALDTIIFFDTVLLGKQPITTPQSEVIFASGAPPGTPMAAVTTIQTYSNILYFTLMWLSTAIVLRFNIQRVGRIKFYILVSLPLIYFLSYYFTIYSTITPATPAPAGSDLLFQILMFGYAFIIGGFLIALAFRSIAKAVHDRIVKYYMLLTAYGFVLFFTTASATILQAPYPPYGLVSVSLVGISSFLVLSGLHYSAVSVSQDVNLRAAVIRLQQKKLEEGKNQIKKSYEQLLEGIKKRQGHQIDTK
jgi:hypothetical protein